MILNFFRKVFIRRMENELVFGLNERNLFENLFLFFNVFFILR